MPFFRFGGHAPYAAIALALSRRQNGADSRKQGGVEGSVLSYVTDHNDAADDEDAHFGERDTRLPPLRASIAGPQRPLWGSIAPPDPLQCCALLWGDEIFLPSGKIIAPCNDFSSIAHKMLPFLLRDALPLQHIAFGRHAMYA